MTQVLENDRAVGPDRGGKAEVPGLPWRSNDTDVKYGGQAFTSRVFVLDFGTLIAQGPTDAVMSDDVVRKAYLLVSPN